MAAGPWLRRMVWVISHTVSMIHPVLLNYIMSFSAGSLRMELSRDFRAVFDKDPAAKSRLQVILTYPGFHAIVMHRIAHRLWGKGLRCLPRFLAAWNRGLTGI